MSSVSRTVDSRKSHRTRKPVRRHRIIGILEQCENRTLLATTFGVTAASDLIQLDSVTAAVASSRPITNIGAGESIQGIDFRPANGQLYALTTDASHTGRLYTINTASAIATLASTINVPVTGTRFGLDFNPVPDRLRVVSDSDLDLRIDVATGAATPDGTLAYIAGDPSSGQDPNVVGSAYINNYPGATATTLYQIDSNLDILAIQNPPNDGTLATVGPLGVDVVSVGGFDVLTTGVKEAPTNQAIAAFQVGGSTGLYTVNLTTGAATLVGPIVGPNGEIGTIVGMAVAPENQPLVNPTNAFGIDVSNNHLVRFNTQTPGTILSSMPILGLQPGETILGLDVQPRTGVLYALGSTSRLYTIDPSIGVATPFLTNIFILPLPQPVFPPPLNIPFTPALNGTKFGFDFDPTGNSIRVVSDTGQDLRLNPISGLVASVDGPLAYGPGDPNFGHAPGVGGAAYLNSVGGVTTRTLYVIDPALDVLAIQDPANAGTLTTVGPLGIDASEVFGFDIRTVGGRNFGYATLAVGNTTSLYQINLTTGAATLIAPFVSPIRGLAIAPEGFSSTIEMLNDHPVAILTGSDNGDTLVIDQAGGLLRHNQYDLGVAGYNSAFDFDTSLPGDQTLSATDRFVSVVVNAGGGNDKVNLGSISTPFGSLAPSFTIDLQGGDNNQLTLDDGAGEIARSIGFGPFFASVSGIGTTITGFGSSLTFINSYSNYTYLHINAGKANDTFHVAETYSLSGFRTILDGGGGSDTLNADARGASVSTTATGLRFLPFQTYSVSVDYARIEQVNVVNVRGRGVSPVSSPVVTNTLAFAGTEFTNNLIARFTDLDPGAKAADYQVTIQWGDGTTSAGSVVQDTNDPTRFSVYGSHHYSASGNFTVTTTIRDTGGTSTTSEPGSWVIHSGGPQWTFNHVSPDGTQWTFHQVSPDGTQLIFYHFSPDGTQFTFEHVNFDETRSVYFDYSISLTPVTITTTYLAEDAVTITSQIQVTDPPIAVEGRLDAASDTGLSNQDGITNDNTPTFTGTSAPGAVIQIFSDIAPATRQLIASAVADANGVWQATVLTPLADGVYNNLVLEAASANGRSRAISSLAPLTVDTVAPTVTNLEFRRLNGQISATFQDDRSGLNQAAVADRANYSFAGIGPVARRYRRLQITGAATTPQGTPTSAQLVNLAINNGRRLRAGRFTFTANSSGIVDVAGNALNGTFSGRFPSGNTQPGGNFVAGLRPLRRIVAVSAPGGTGATNQSGNRQAALKKNGGNAHPPGPNQRAHLANHSHAAASFKAQGRKVGR